MNIKKYTEKDRYGNMFSYEFDIPSMQEVPQPDPSIFKPKGTDTVPAMLTPGENVVNAEASRLPGVQPMLDELNDAGRAIQKKQGGPIPSYKQEGGIVIDDTMLDAIKQVESGGDVNAVSKVGASGPYQIMKATALKPGYGVTPIGLDERFDPNKSRTFAKQYLEGIMKANPDFTRDEVITAYHSGAGNVRKAKMGQEELGPRGQAYAPKVKMAMNKNEVPMPEPRPAVFDDTPIEGGFMSAQASTKDDSVPKSDTGGSLEDIIRRVPTSISDFFGGIKDKLDSQEKVEDKFYEFYEARNELENVNQDINLINEQLKTAEGSKAERLKKRLNELTKRQSKLQIEVPKLNQEYKDIPKEKGILGADTPIIGSENIIDTDKDLKSVGLKPIEEKKRSANKVIKQIDAVGYDEGKLTLDAADDAWAKKNLTGKYEGDFSQYLINKGKQVGGTILDKSMEYFKGAFSDMFDGEELARMALIYAGSRALGYDHLPSIKYGMKNYMKRVDANLDARKKFVLSDKGRDNYTLESLKKYSETGDINDLVAKGTGSPVKMSGKGYLRGYGQVTLFDNKDGIQMAQIGNKYVPVSSLPIEQWDDKTHGDIAVQGRLNEIEKNFLSDLNQGKDKDDDEFVPRELVGAKANKRYREILRQNGVSLNEAPQTEIAIQEGIKDYYRAIKEWKKSGAKEGKPESVIPFINQRIFVPLTGLPQSLIAGASVANLNKLSNMIKDDMDIKNPQSETYRDAFKESWQSVLTAFRLLPESEQQKYIRQGAETKGHTAFTLFFQDKGIDGVEAILKS